MPQARGSIAFFGTYRPPVPLDIYSSPIKLNNAKNDEELITDRKSSNFNGHVIPQPSLAAILSRQKVKSSFSKDDEKGNDEEEEDEDEDEDEDEYEGDNSNNAISSGMAFVSERTNSLETLHFALRSEGKPSMFQVFNFGNIYDGSIGAFNGVRMEDSPCFAGNYIIYISTKDPATEHRQPWTAVYRTDLKTGKTDRLTPPGTADLTPSVSPSGKKIAVATFQYKHGGWTGEIEHLETAIVVMDVDGSNRTLVVTNGGWPTWGTEDILFFHRGEEQVVEEIDKDNTKKKKVVKKWGVFQADISRGFAFETPRVTPKDIDAMTPAAINATTVVVATIREKLGVAAIRKNPEQYRHIEIFYTSKPQQDSTRITQTITPMADHYNPFVMEDMKSIGYHRCRSGDLKSGDVSREFDELQSPDENVGLLRVSGVFPTFSSDGKKLAFVDNEFKKIWLADSEGGLRPICSMSGRNKVFCPVWNQNPNKDTLYICRGEAFSFGKPVVIDAIQNASLDYGPGNEPPRQQLTENGCNSAFPSTNREGTKLVFRSTRDWVGVNPPAKMKYRNLYMMDTDSGDFLNANPKRLTKGEWMDSHCQWSPIKGSDWIVFSSTRDKPEGTPNLDNGLDPGYYAVFLMSVKDVSNPVVVRVIGSREFDVAGHVNHPCFSPDGMSIVFTSDMAAISVDPISLPLFVHSVRPYGDVFSLDLIDTNNIKKNENIRKVIRITHSRYENSTPCWNVFSIQHMISLWNKYLDNMPKSKPGTGGCPHVEGWHMTGHLNINKRCC